MSEAVAELTTDPDNVDLQAVLRVQIGKLLTTDPDLAAQVRALMEQADTATGRTITTTVTASGKGAVAAERDNTGQITTGDQSPIYAPRLEPGSLLPTRQVQVSPHEPVRHLEAPQAQQFVGRDQEWSGCGRC
ncbi:hypothetical protein [Streptosporangium sp. NPDC051022]|uniref:hypothetical protein n=1 Tax=Streptosporangium sp. NPDC051022 TaxID=3155752 RepID=UPI00342BB99B